MNAYKQRGQMPRLPGGDSRCDDEQQGMSQNRKLNSPNSVCKSLAYPITSVVEYPLKGLATTRLAQSNSSKG